MIKYKWSETLKRKIRQDDLKDISIPTWKLVSEAVKAGRTEEALEFLDYGCYESMVMHDTVVTMVDQSLTHLASINEEEVGKFWKKRYVPKTKEWLDTTPGLMESLQRNCEYQRGHFGSDFSVTEEEDRYIVKVNLCGSGGKLRKSGNCGRTKKAYPWSWGKVGIPYYCTHCCIFLEINAIKMRGYPVRIHQLDDKQNGQCIHLYYKKPELIPEEYFTRLGKVKTIR